MTLLHQDYADGSGAAVTSLTTPGPPVTFMGWVRPTALPATAALFGWWDAPGSVATTGLALYAQRGDFGTPGVLQGNVRVDGALRSVHGPTLVLGERVHVALSYDGATARLYLGAEEVGSLSAPGGMTKYPHLNVFTAGASVEDLRVYDEALSPAAIQAIMAPPPAAPSLATAFGPDLSGARLAIEALMDDQCRVTDVIEPDDWVLDEDLRLVPPDDAPLVYEGPCKVNAAGGQAAASAPGAVQTSASKQSVDFPLDRVLGGETVVTPAFKPGMSVTVTASRRDPAAVGQVFVVTELVIKTMAVKRQVLAERRDRIEL